MNSFKLFQANLNQAKKEGLHTVITFGIYSRLKNLVQDEIPQLNWQEKYAYMERELEGSKVVDLKNIDLEKVQLLKKSEGVDESEPKSDLERWAEDTLFCVVVKRRYGDWSLDQNVLYLFRLLAISYKILVARAQSKAASPSNESQKIGETHSEPSEVVSRNLIAVLESKIVSAMMM